MLASQPLIPHVADHSPYFLASEQTRACHREVLTAKSLWYGTRVITPCQPRLRFLKHLTVEESASEQSSISGGVQKGHRQIMSTWLVRSLCQEVQSPTYLVGGPARGHIIALPVSVCLPGVNRLSRTVVFCCWTFSQLLTWNSPCVISAVNAHHRHARRTNAGIPRCISTGSALLRPTPVVLEGVVARQRTELLSLTKLSFTAPGILAHPHKPARGCA